MRSQGPEPGGRELDRERHTIETPADAGHRCVVVLGQLETGVGRFGPRGEQRDGLVHHQLRDRRLAVSTRGDERRHGVGRLARDPECLAACGQNPQLRTRLKQRRGDHAALGDQALAIVQHQQLVPVGQMLHQQVQGSARRRLAQSQLGGDEVRQQLRVLHRCGMRVHITNRREVDEPHPVGERPSHCRGHPLHQTRLAHTADPGQRDQPRVREQPLDLSELPAPPHKAREIRREPSRGPRRGRIRHDILVPIRRLPARPGYWQTSRLPNDPITAAYAPATP